jgi:hypothetical protein
MATEQELRRLIQQAASDGRVPCKVLLALAERSGTPPPELRRLCDDMDIRISNCQLGCFT